MNDKIDCPNCLNGHMRTFHRADGVPTNSCILLPTLQDAKDYPTGDIHLGFCKHCGFVSNTAFDKALTEYSGRYEETQGFSPTFNQFHRRLANKLIEQYDLHGKHILEIGCGKGEFLLLLCEDGQNRGTGFDPGYRPDRFEDSVPDTVEFVTDFYSEKYADRKADFVCCKMTLEHIPKTAHFIDIVRSAVGDSPSTTVFFMIPETERILKDCAFEDIYYEHCSYFTPHSLKFLFKTNGFDVISTNNEYDGQYLCIEARPRSGEAEASVDDSELQRLGAWVEEFPQQFENRRRDWLQVVNDAKDNNQKVVLWGSGSKGVSFLTTLGLTSEIDCAVDINPHRQGYYMPTTGHMIVSPEDLQQRQPDKVIVMNPIYKNEINDTLNSLGLSPEILTL